MDAPTGENRIVDDETVDDEPAVVEVRDVVKEFTGRRGRRWWHRRPARPALDGVSFTIRPGTVLGYAGGTGAGKTTLVDLITGSAVPAGGTVTTLGLRPDAAPEELGRRLGVVSGTRSQLWRDLAVDDSLRIVATAHGLSESRWRIRRGELVDRLGLASFVNLSAGQLSPGRRIRAETAAALIHEPDLLLLDEPTLGLDVVSKERLRSFLQDESRLYRRTMLLTTADLADVEQLCDRLLVVEQGRVIHDGDLPGLIARAGVERVLVVDLTVTDHLLNDVPGARLVEVEAGGLRQRLSFTPGTVPASRVLADVAARSGIRDLTLVDPTLDDLIQRLL